MRHESKRGTGRKQRGRGEDGDLERETEREILCEDGGEGKGDKGGGRGRQEIVRRLRRASPSALGLSSGAEGLGSHRQHDVGLPQTEVEAGPLGAQWAAEAT